MNASSFRRTLLQAGLLAMVAATGFALTRHVVLPQVGAATASAPATLVATSARAELSHASGPSMYGRRLPTPLMSSACPQPPLYTMPPA